jgi:hypothetical protein
MNLPFGQFPPAPPQGFPSFAQPPAPPAPAQPPAPQGFYPQSFAQLPAQHLPPVPGQVAQLPPIQHTPGAGGPPLPQPGMPQFAPPTAPGTIPPPPVGAAANLSEEARRQAAMAALTQPQRAPRNNNRAPDGTYVVYLTEVALDVSRRDGRKYLKIAYQIVEGTVPQAVGVVCETIMFIENMYGIKDFISLARNLWPESQIQAWLGQGVKIEDMAAAFGQQATGKYAWLAVERRPKPGQPIEAAFPNHYWRAIGDQRPSLQQRF